MSKFPRGGWAGWAAILVACLSVVVTIAVWFYFHEKP